MTEIEKYSLEIISRCVNDFPESFRTIKSSIKERDELQSKLDAIEKQLEEDKIYTWGDEYEKGATVYSKFLYNKFFKDGTK